MFSIDMDQISHLAKKVVQEFRNKSKSIKKDNGNTSINSYNLPSLNKAHSFASNSQENNSIQLEQQSLSTNASTFSTTTTSSAQNPVQKRAKFTPQEDEVILKYVASYGKKWSEIAKRLPGRTEIMVRNRYYVKIRKMAKEQEAINQTNDFLQCSESSQGQDKQISDIKQEGSEYQITQDNIFSKLIDSESVIELNCENQFFQQSQQQDMLILQNEDYQQNNFASIQDIPPQQSYLIDSTQNVFPNQPYQNSNILENVAYNQHQQFVPDLFLNHNQQNMCYDNELQISPFPVSSHLLLNQNEEEDDFFEEAGKPFKMPNIVESSTKDYSNSLLEQQNTVFQQEAQKQEKITFLQNQISMIENMLNLCKDEIIREFAQRSQISTAAAVEFNSELIARQRQQSENHLTSLNNSQELFQHMSSQHNFMQDEDVSMDIEAAAAQDRVLFDEEERILQQNNFHDLL